MLLAFTLLLGLAVPASAEYMYRGYEFNPDSTGSPFTQVGQGNSQSDMSTAKYYDMSNSNLFLIAYYLLRNLDGGSIKKYLYDQNTNASFYPVQYLAYALHGLKGSINSGGTIIASNDLGSNSKDYFLTRWANMNSNATITDANRWRVQTVSDNSQYSWLYQVASGAGSMQLLTDALMNWSNPSFGMYSPADTANYSWFNQMLQAVDSSKTDISLLATESTLSSLYDRFTTNNSYFSYSGAGSKLQTVPDPLKALNYSLTNFASLFVPVKRQNGTYVTPLFSYDYLTSYNGRLSSYSSSGSFIPAVLDSLGGIQTGERTINSNLLKLDEVLSTENDRALEAATDDTKVNVKDYVTDKKSNYGDSFTIGNTISDGLKPDLSTAQASSAVGGLFSPESSDYWGWFSSATDSDLHPAASGVSTLSLEDEPSPQDVADSETVWVINPYSSASDVVSDFFGGE